ncbi:hypothetical protein BH10BDE1_BH10BDE1_07870 [soil metagenome]
MKVKPSRNVGVEVFDLDIASMSKLEYQELTELFFSELIVLIRNQKPDAAPFAKIVHKFGDIVNLNQCAWDERGIEIAPYATLNPFEWYPGLGPFPVQRVTGKKVDNKDSGIFGSGILDWHCNINGVTWAPGVGLQAVAGVEGTHTSWMDTTKAYDDLTPELKTRCEGVIGHFKYSPDVWAEGLADWQKNYMTQNQVNEYRMPLVNVSERGRKGLYFHFLNECSFPSDPALLDILKQHCFQSKYIQTVDWRPGDIHLSHQILTLHRREENDPKILAERVLNRYTFNFNKIFPGQKPLYMK